MEKYYAVKVGKKTGIFHTWDECRPLVHGFAGAVYKSFKTRKEAEDFLGDAAGAGVPDGGSAPKNLPGIYAFVDGSYNAAKKIYGYGGFLVHDGKKEILQGKGTDEEMASMRNVAGEVMGSMAAIEKALELGLSELTIYYDYMGIEMWAVGAWKRNKTGTAAYHDYVESVRDKICLCFVKVRGHAGIEGNEEADRLAKQAVGNQ